MTLHEGNITRVPCKSHYSFACSRNAGKVKIFYKILPDKIVQDVRGFMQIINFSFRILLVIRCPNGCFHNGDCIGSTCFCYRGWTGEDCSKPHCRDVHNCSDFGECIGPNTCKCRWSFQGRACTYSYCSKFRNCSTCVSDQFCGWCDKMQQCMPGDYSRPYKKSCPDWFYYNCYTVGSENHCSDDILVRTDQILII